MDHFRYEFTDPIALTVYVSIGIVCFGFLLYGILTAIRTEQPKTTSCGRP